VPTIDDGLDIDNLDETSEAEIDSYLTRMWRFRGSLYEVSANSVWLDTRPDFAKLHRWGARLFGRPDPEPMLMMGIANLFSYVHMAWEPGIHNQFRVLQRQGLAKAQLMDIVMVAQLSAGMRGLQCVYNAVGTLLPDFQDRPVKPAFPAGWEVDPDAFRCGLDLSTRELTPHDVHALTDWYVRTMGEVPRSVRFASRYHPMFLKAQRAKWESAIRTLPKQVMPYLMLRHTTANGFQDGIRQAALLGKAWGMSREWIVNPVMHTAYYFTGLQGLGAAERALRPILDDWEAS